MFFGLVGAVVPVLPGAPLIWLGILIWAWADQFQKINWLVLVVLGILALIATASEYFLTPLVTRGQGVSVKGTLGALVGGILGGFFLSELPIVGTLFGAILGALLGTIVVTFLEQRNHRKALSAGKNYLFGCAVSSLVEIILSVLMLVIFAWRAFF